MLIGAEWTGHGPGTVIHDYRKCVDLASGRSLPNPAHHDNIHEGTAGHAVQKSGHLVVPTAPLTPLTGCDMVDAMFGK
jgi:hypothetical protein